jgi:hypothetical protein
MISSLDAGYRESETGKNGVKGFGKNKVTFGAFGPMGILDFPIGERIALSVGGYDGQINITSVGLVQCDWSHGGV